ncbi:protein FAM83G-like [Carcharodon carcharias]|uniref:protein FAM83G-like n=1 Tax=Carcharodon carcharias TaxID=13397 RepID=UPI001B7ED38D|nr:protein FAM83G-like [Carcharodon carcharias]
MALSQLLCLDEGNINYRTNESKPEFYYSEAQRLALETLLASGGPAFRETVAKENLREFLSELDIQQILGSMRDFLPEGPSTQWQDEEGQEEGRGGGVEEEGKGGESEGEGRKASEEPEKKPLSLHYWPDTSDVSRPCLELGWPESSAYRGVTRATVYTQPPVAGSIHIKEMVRRMISQAQKVIAVVMDLFTDIDIFKDLLDASFKRKVPVYIIHDDVNIKHFLKMCESSGMHMGMLKNLRVYSVGGTEFHTRSAKTIVGRQMQKFLLIDGDRAVCGSYSFTWTASRLDRNIITVISGQAVETFDNEFRELLHFSRAVNMRKLNLAPEVAEPEPVQQAPVLTAEQSAAIARKLINPKYALVRANNPKIGSESSEKKLDSNNDSKNQPNDPNKTQKAAMVADPNLERLINHPALLDMPRVDLFVYLPTYPEIPQNEKQWPNGSSETKERNLALCGSDTVEMFTKLGSDSSNQAMAQQHKATCKNPDVAQTEDLAMKEDPFQNRPQTGGNNRDSENKPELNLSTAKKRMLTPKAKQKPKANVGKLDMQLTGTIAVTSTQHKDNWVNETLRNSTEAAESQRVDSNLPTYREHDDEQAANVLEREDDQEKEALTPAMNETEVGTESNKAEPDDKTLPEEADSICVEDNCPSNASTNCTPDWNTDDSSLHDLSVASSDSDDFYDCDFVDSNIKKAASQFVLSKADDEFAIGEVNNVVSRGTFERPSNNYKQLSQSMNDVREGKSSGSKDVNTFFQERAAMRQKALDKLKVTLAINYQDKFQRNRYAIPTKPTASMLRPTVDTLSLHSLHSVSRSPDLNKSRRLMHKSLGLPGSRMPHKNYQKVMPYLSVTKLHEQLHEQKGPGSIDFTAGLSMAESSNCSGISMDSENFFK